MERSILEPLLNIGLSFASLPESKKNPRFNGKVTNLAISVIAPSFKNLPGRLSIPAAWEISVLLIFSEQYIKLLVSCLNLCKIYLLNQYHVYFGEGEAFVAMFLPYK